MKLLLGLMLLAVTTTSFADDIRGRFTLSDGSNIFRIEVGQEKGGSNSAPSPVNELYSRIFRLERAVRDLQNRVYDLQENVQPELREVKVATCTLETPFNGTYLGKGSTENQATFDAIRQCEKKADTYYCNGSRVKKCETSTELVRFN
jgi:hypothetical protein